MSRQLSLYKYIPKRRHTEEEEETTSDSVVINTVSSIQTALVQAEADDLALTPESSPRQPVNVEFPITYFSGKARSFNSDWFRQYPWLEYSVKKDAAFCYPCRLFNLTQSSTGTSRPEKAFTTLGFRDWKHATGSTGMLISHNNCISHKQAIIAWEQFKSTSTRAERALALAVPQLRPCHVYWSTAPHSGNHKCRGDI